MTTIDGTDRYDPRIATAATGLLAVANQVGVLDAADVHVAQRLAALAGELDESVLLAAALVVRATRRGSTCVDLSDLLQIPELAGIPGLPSAEALKLMVRDSILTGEGGPLRWDSERLYLDRYWRLEVDVAAALKERETAAAPALDPAALDLAVARVFGKDDEQAAAVRLSAQCWTSVIAGGPGTGKTTTVARLLAVVAAITPGQARMRIALAAPTGKAAARLTTAIDAQTATLPEEDRGRLGHLNASTVDRLLGTDSRRPGRFRHNADNRLPHDLIVVDEASMISLTMMARLLEAVRPQTRLVLVGDPGQLASVEAGAVLADIVDGFAQRSKYPGAPQQPAPVATLTRVRRHGAEIADLASAVRAGEWEKVRAVRNRCATPRESAGSPAVEPNVEFVLAADRQTAVAGLRELHEAALQGRAERALELMDHHRVLCGPRSGPDGVAGWNRDLSGWLGLDRNSSGEWYAGRPLLVTKNDYLLNLFNGDTGIVVRHPELGLQAAFLANGELRLISPSRLAHVETAYAMTVHRSQGSQFEQVTLVLPPLDSPLLTRELLYTGLTRAMQHLRIVGSEEQLQRAVQTPAARATGLQQRLAT